jgi:hypothetical protein
VRLDDRDDEFHWLSNLAWACGVAGHAFASGGGCASTTADNQSNAVPDSNFFSNYLK